jgi:hypothetical protein
MWSTNTFPHFLVIHILLHAGESEIAELNIPVLVHEYVGAFEVTMQDLPPVEVIEP